MVVLKLCATLAAIGLTLSLGQASANSTSPNSPSSGSTSPMTAAFMANVAANLAILDTSARLAKDNTRNGDIIAYAKDETTDAGQVAVALAQAVPTNANVAMADAAGGAVLSGRSVAVVGMTGRIAPASEGSVLEAANARMPATADLATLKTLHGRAFDRLFFIMQLDALSQIESDYRTYISEGDDPAIATMAHEQLPALMKRLEALTRA